MEIDGSEECEKLDSVLWELGKVLVDHFKSAFKDILHNRGYLIFHEGLENVSARTQYCQVNSITKMGMHH